MSMIAAPIGSPAAQNQTVMTASPSPPKAGWDILPYRADNMPNMLEPEYKKDGDLQVPGPDIGPSTSLSP